MFKHEQPVTFKTDKGGKQQRGNNTVTCNNASSGTEISGTANLPAPFTLSHSHTHTHTHTHSWRWYTRADLIINPITTALKSITCNKYQ